MYLRLCIQPLFPVTPLYNDCLKKTATITRDDLSGMLIDTNWRVFTTASRFSQISVHAPRSFCSEQCSLSADTGHISLQPFLLPAFYPAKIHGPPYNPSIRENVCRQDQRSKWLTGEEGVWGEIIGNPCDKIMLPSAEAMLACRFTRGPQRRVGRPSSP